MKPVILIACLASSCQLFSQYQTVTLYSGKIKLNSIQGSRFRGGGLSAKRVQSFTVPANTVACFYSFTTSVDSTSLGELNLALDLGARVGALVATGGISATGVGNQLINEIQIPISNVVVNAYVFDGNNTNAFLNNQASARFLPQGYVTGAREAKQQAGALAADTYFIGLQNPDGYKAAFVNLEVVAIVQGNAA